jgi:nicotinate-nucleotide pyrophosphorylase (carboxylating)
MNTPEVHILLERAFREDIGFGDLSSTTVFSSGDHSAGTFTAKAGGVIAGLGIIEQGYRLLSGSIEVSLLKHDGDRVKPGDDLARVSGSTAMLLSGERVILNFLQHLSGIASATARAVEALKGSGIRVCDTRKTLPGLRMLQKYAVRCGGGFNHRYRLDDGVMLKDNHIAAAGSIAKAVQQVREQVGLMVRIEVETETREQVLEAVDAGADIIMLDNCSPEKASELAALVPDHIITEISGGITEQTISKYRNANVDYISLGYLTHSVTALDISFNLNQSTKQHY